MRPVRAIPRQPIQNLNAQVHLPAPIGGLNAINAGSAMPPTDCVLLYNMLASEYGLRARLGSREWAYGLTGAGDNYVRSVIPFKGSAANGSADKNFATTSSGIWDVTSSAAGTLVLPFGITSGRAGHGVTHVQVTAAGHFMLYFDEENGLCIYQQGGAWDAAPAITGVSAANLVGGTVFKGRVIAVEKDTANLWYSSAGSIVGAYTKFAIGPKLKAGGPLRNVWNWTYDGGAGLDDSLVAISDGGDVAIYQGTDPASATTFGLRGVWQVGDIPAGREIATDLGGDMLIATRLGLIPLSKLVVGQNVTTSQYATAKITSLFNAAMLSKATTNGWSLRLHPEENALIVTVPEAEGVATTQLAMSLSTQSWSRLRDLPIYSSGVFGGKFYFGTTDGSVYINDGYVDGRTLAAPEVYTPVQYAGLSAFQNFGNGRSKQIHNIRPYFMGESTAPSFDVAARYNFDLTELGNVTMGVGGANVWDTGLWDSAVWQGDYAPSYAVRGAVGMGVHAAIAWRGAAVARTVLTGFDVEFQSGGFL